MKNRTTIVKGQQSLVNYRAELRMGPQYTPGHVLRGPGAYTLPISVHPPQSCTAQTNGG
jgi:hypothetical protein